MSIKDLKPKKHGNPVLLDLRNKKTYDDVCRLTDYNNSITIHLAYFIASLKDDKLNINCMQCWKDVALLCNDLGELMKEMVKDK